MRLLLLEQNRFHSLLVERAIAERFPDWVVAIFRDLPSAIAELQSNQYEFVVCDIATATGGEGLEWLMQSCQLNLIVLGSDKLDFRSLLEVQPNRISLMLTKNDQFVSQLVAFLGNQPTQENRIACVVSDDPTVCPAHREAVALTSRTIAHEINNPLMAISGMAELILRESGRLDIGTRRKVEAIAESAGRIKSIITALAQAEQLKKKQTVVGEYLAVAQGRPDRLCGSIKS